jgi:hypothetical protein
MSFEGTSYTKDSKTPLTERKVVYDAERAISWRKEFVNAYPRWAPEIVSKMIADKNSDIRAAGNTIAVESRVETNRNVGV